MVISGFIPTSKNFLQVCDLSFHSHTDGFQRVEVIVVSILICFGTFSKSLFTIFVFLNSVVLLFVSIVLCKLPQFDSCCFQVNLEIMQCDSNYSFNILWAILVLLLFCKSFRSSQLLPNTCWNYDWAWVKFIDQFGKNCYLNEESSNP